VKIDSALRPSTPYFTLWVRAESLTTRSVEIFGFLDEVLKG